MKGPIFSTHGCRLNTYETEAMKQLAVRAGVENAIVVNTCAVTAAAVRKARQDIRALRHAHPKARMIVTGCAAQTDPAGLAAMDGVDMVLGNAEKMRAQTWADLGTRTGDPVQVGDIMAVKQIESHAIDGFGTRSRAYVQIQNGCNHRCTFCIIPYGRGNSRSVPADDVVDQIRRLVGNGYREVVLTGVDLTSWGEDIPGRPRLGALVNRILHMVPDLARLRLSSLDSVEVDGALMQAMATQPRLMPHLHLSLQHGADLILKRMKRRHSRADAIGFCTTMRRLRPDIVFGADIIAGFPTETEAHFRASLSLVTACRLTWLHVFPYSARQGTPAARMPQLDSATIKARANQLRTQARAQSAAHQAAWVGTTQPVLMETARRGRTPHFAVVQFDRDQPMGRIVRARLTGQGTDGLCGVALE